MPEGSLPVHPGSDDLKSPAFRDEKGRLVPAVMGVTQPLGEGTAVLPITQENPLPVSNGSFDAFGRLRVSQSHTLFDSKQLYDKAPLFWDEVIDNVSGNAASTHSVVDADVTMHVESGDSIIRQTFARFNYQPGKSQLVLFTGVLGVHPSGVTARMGYFDENNGLFLESVDGVIAFVERKDGVDTKFIQSSWSKDKLDGTGLSGVTIDFSKIQLFWFDLEWLGVGTVRYGFLSDGAFLAAHHSHHANLVERVYISTPNLPLRYELSSTGPTAEMHHNCSTVIVEGGIQASSLLHSISNETPVKANSSGTIYALIGLRLKTTHLGIIMGIADFSVLSLAKDNFEWLLLHNPTVDNVFTYSDIADSGLQVARPNADSPSPNVVSDVGYRVTGGFVSEVGRDMSGGLGNSLRLGASIAGVRDEVVLAVRALSINLDVHGSLSWREDQ